MLFNSIAFLIFLPLVFTLYWILSKRSLRIQNLFLLLSSLTFYGWWDWRFIGLIVFSTVVDYFCGLAIHQSSSKRASRGYMLLSICSNLGILGFFKYYNFFIESWIDLWANLGIEANFHTMEIILPVGISFYTFQTMSYTIDIYRGQLRPTQDFISFFAFVSFFPQLVAGPIERAANLLPQILTRREFRSEYATSGVYLITWGLFKKVAVGDNLGVIVDSFYSNVDLYSQNVLFTSISVLFYSLQIYCDFSGYSDIAIGTARLFGVQLNTNFLRPYFSKSFSEFWRRWHISLSTWLRDYLYIPLGGNRYGKWITYRNLMITMLLGGLWHGASFNFIFWGALHGLLLVLERAVRYFKLKTFNALSVLLVFVATSCVWIPFRSQSLADTSSIFGNLFTGKMSSDLPISYFDVVEGIMLVSIVFLIDFIEEKGIKTQNLYTAATWVALLFLIGNWRAVSFIYFQF